MDYTKFINRGIIPINLFTVIIFMYSLSIAQNVRAPVPITDFDGNTSYVEFDYAGPDPSTVNYLVVYETRNSEYIYQGETSRRIYWNFERGQYCGWGVDLLNDGNSCDASGFTYLTFYAKGIVGNERFHIKIKDANGKEPMRNSNYYNRNISEWTKFSVPLADFNNVDLTRLININLGFNITISGETGTIYIDDFKFEYENE